MSLLKDALRAAFGRVQFVSIALLPLYQAAARPGRPYRIPVLAYHKIVADAAVARRMTCAVTARDFEHHMEWLGRGGFTPLTVTDYVDCVIGGGTFPPRSVLITFDDGYHSVYSRAYPILRRLGFPAVVFLTTGYVGGGRVFPDDEKYADLPAAAQEELMPLTWDQVRRMSDLITPASHTVSHLHLGRQSDERIRAEVEGSRRALETNVGGNLDVFAYPHGIQHHGDYNDATRQALIEAGYRVAFNSEIGRNGRGTDPYGQHRIEAKRTDSYLLFMSRLWGACDWVGWAQSLFHRAFAPEGIR